MPDPPKIRMRTFYAPLVGFESALHRRGNSWYIVFPRAYGMLYGVKLHGVLNDERTAPNHDPPSSSESDLNPRFWFRDGSDYVDGEVNLRVRWHDLVTADPQFLKDSGLRRTVRLGDGKEVEERLLTDSAAQKYCGGRKSYASGVGSVGSRSIVMRTAYGIERWMSVKTEDRCIGVV
ncbi:hypothetical protein LTR97_008697 [Elasticomyces elasticus]|uniref:Uncharacterized protein n=1 Tax=Elasticomyces elasticus TaxID=574655 RepID=A0AAN7ZM79_9PEZI|nr:hypothetical protein LTR97_008697 [Elasticomyces elasticus]